MLCLYFICLYFVCTFLFPAESGKGSEKGWQDCKWQVSVLSNHLHNNNIIFCYCYHSYNNNNNNKNSNNIEVSGGSFLIICTIIIFYCGRPFFRIIWINNLEFCLGNLKGSILDRLLGVPTLTWKQVCWSAWLVFAPDICAA